MRKTDYKCMMKAKHKNSFNKEVKLNNSKFVLNPYSVDNISLNDLEKLIKEVKIKHGEEKVESWIKEDKVPTKLQRKANLNQQNNKISYELAILDSGCDTSAIGGSAWIIEEDTGRTINITGHTHIKTAIDNISVVTAVTAVDLPDN